MDELDLIFNNKTEWNTWRDQAARESTAETRDSFGEAILAKGFQEPITRVQVDPGDIKRGTNWREGLAYKRVNSRTRAVLLLIEKLVGDRPRGQIPIYAAEAVTGFALRMRGEFARFLGTEFALDEEAARRLFPIQCENLMALSLPDGRFEIASTNEVLEHVPDLDTSLREIARILMPGGWHIGTVPFAHDKQDMTVRAVIEGGDVKHLLPPEYHGNPVDPSGGSLVFQIPGWDILDRCRAAGFSSAGMRFVVSRKHGVVGEFVLACQK